MHKLSYMDCDTCGFVMTFKDVLVPSGQEALAVFCIEHKFGVGITVSESKRVRICNHCSKPMDIYRVYAEDNVCPICQHFLNMLSVLDDAPDAM